MDKKVLVVYVESWADVNGLYSLRPLGVYSSTEKAREAIDNLGDAEYSYGAKFNHGGGGYYDEDLADMDEFFDIEDDGLIEYAVNIVNLDSLTDFSVQHILDIEDEEMPEEVNEVLEEQAKDKEQEIYIITQHDSPNGGDWDQKILGTYLSAEMAKKAVKNLLEMQSTSSEYSKDNSRIDPYFFGYKINKVVLNAPAITSEESLECVFDNVKKGDQKYELTDETKKIEINGKTRTVYRIRALKDFTCQGRAVHTGDLGGFVSSEGVLSQGGTAWIFDDACVLGAEITGDVSIADNAKIGALGEYSSIKIKDNAKIYGNVEIVSKFSPINIDGNVKIHDNAKVGPDDMVYINDNAEVFGNAKVNGTVKENAQVFGNAEINDGHVGGYSRIYGEAKILKAGVVKGNAEVYEKATIGSYYAGETNEREETTISGNAKICGNTWVHGNARVYDNAQISGNAVIDGGVCESVIKIPGTDELTMNTYGDEAYIRIHGNAHVYGDAKILKKTEIYDDARVSGEAVISNSKVYKDAKVNGIMKLFNKIYPEENKVNDIISEAKNLAEGKTLIQPAIPKVNKEKNKKSQSLDD